MPSTTPKKGQMIGFPQRFDPHAPSPKDVRCAGCGCWNRPDESRCERCGRRMDAAPGAQSRRGAEDADALPAPPVAEAPKPPPEPEWKQELNRRLAGYREKKQFDESSQGPVLDPETPLEPLPRSSRAAIPAIPPPKRSRSTGERPASLPPLRNRQGKIQPPAPPSEPKPGRRSAELREPGSDPVRGPGPPALTPPIIDRRAPETPRAARKSGSLEARLAPLSLRAMAGVMDVAVVLVALGLFLAVVRMIDAQALAAASSARLIGVTFFAMLAFYWVYYLRYLGRTAGMAWIGLRLLNFDAEQPDAVQRRNRALGSILSAASMGIGFAWAAADEQRLCWHDRMSKTFVALEDPTTR